MSISVCRETGSEQSGEEAVCLGGAALPAGWLCGHGLAPLLLAFSPPPEAAIVFLAGTG